MTPLVKKCIRRNVDDPEQEAEVASLVSSDIAAWAKQIIEPRSFMILGGEAINRCASLYRVGFGFRAQ